MKRLVFLTSAFLLGSSSIAMAVDTKPVTPPSAQAPLLDAPNFDVKDVKGKSHKLSDYKGSWLVLEWTNPECPFVKKHYGSNNMQALQEKYTADAKETKTTKARKAVAWLTINSSAIGKEGYMDAKDAIKQSEKDKIHSTALILDPDGTLGKAYGATATPHMFVINPDQKIVYAGAIDDNDSRDPKVIPNSKNYVASALDEGMAGEKIATPLTRAYGCSVKYK